MEDQRAGLGGVGAGIVALEEAFDLLAQALAVLVPFAGAKDVHGGFLDVKETDFVCPGGAEFIDLAAQHGKKFQLHGATVFLQQAQQADLHWRRHGLESLGDGFAADVFEHAPHFIIERGQGQQAQRAFVLQVVEDALADFIDEGEILAVRIVHGAA